MALRKPRRGSPSRPLAQGGSRIREGLPAPLVYYPNQGGIFLGFAASPEELPALCQCGEGAVRNLIRLAAAPGSGGPVRLEPLDFGFFPDAISLTFLGREDPGAALRFRPGLCHRCNLAAPSLRYCHEINGTRFVQTYGWYINQTYLRLGIHPTSYLYLPDVCPPEYHDVLNRIRALMAQARSLRLDLARQLNDPRREAPSREPLEQIEFQLGRPRYELAKAVENLTRAEFGFRPVGELWVNETQCYRVICRLFPGEEVLRRHRPEWMEGLELDIYLPGRRLAVEYQGQQHFHPIKAWGGEEALRQLQARDARKAEICRETGITLVTVEYTEPLTDEHLQERIGG